MKRIVVLIAVAGGLTAGAGCARTEVTREARDVASDVRAAAATAGNRLADSWVTAKVQARFFADEDVKARHIDVKTRDGAVTLEGVVESDAVRHRALALARGVEGVQQVEDRLLVGRVPEERLGQETSSAQPPLSPPSSTPDPGVTASEGVPDDSMVTSLIQAQYFVDPRLKLRDIDVTTSNRVVTLQGEVASDDERARALLLARTTAGVERVEDGLSVDASLTVPGPATGTGDSLSAAPIDGAPVVPPHSTEGRQK